MKATVLIVFATAMVFIPLSSCKKSGCTDPKALNRDYDAKKDDGTCIYSRVGFYASASTFNGIPISKVDLSINGVNIGTTNGVVYPNGPGNCTTPGTITYQFESGSSVDWNATVNLVNGAIIYSSGQVSPSISNECLRVNMTP